MSLPAIEKEKKYKRLAPHGSTSNIRWVLRTHKYNKFWHPSIASNICRYFYEDQGLETDATPSKWKLYYYYYNILT